MSNKIFVASDHGGFDLKGKVVQLLENNYEILDLGTHSTDSVDYPDYAIKMAKAIFEEPDSRGVLICGSGQGMAITANRFSHIRAALCWNEEIAHLARAHNNANVLCLGGRVMDHDLALKVCNIFFTDTYEGGRHDRRLDKIKGAKL